MRRGVGAVCAAAMIGVAGLAFAQAPGPSTPSSNVELAWSAPAECPARAVVEREIRTLLEGSTVTGNAVVARADVTRSGQKWRVELAIRTGQGSGERAFEAASCTELASAVALIVALAVDPSRRPPETDAAPPPVVAPPPVTDASPSTPAPTTAAPPPPTAAAPPGDDGPRVAVGAEAVGDLGVLPAASFGGGLSLSLLLGRLRLEARGRLFVSQRALDPAQRTQGVDLDLLAGGGRGCFTLFRPGDVTVAPCGGLEVDRVAAAGFGAANGASAFATSSTWGSFGAGLLATWAPLRMFALRLDAELLAPFARPSFVVLAPDGSVAGVLHRPSPLGSRVGLGVEFRFF